MRLLSSLKDGNDGLWVVRDTNSGSGSKGPLEATEQRWYSDLMTSDGLERLNGYNGF